MIGYAFKRFLGAVPTLFIIVTVAFFMMRAAPGSPFDSDRRLPPEIKANVETKTYTWDVVIATLEDVYFLEPLGMPDATFLPTEEQAARMIPEDPEGLDDALATAMRELDGLRNDLW